MYFLVEVRSEEGDAHLLGSLAIGTMVNSVQLRPESEARTVTAAGSSALILRKLDNGTVLIRLPSKQEVTSYIVIGTNIHVHVTMYTGLSLIRRDSPGDIRFVSKLYIKG